MSARYSLVKILNNNVVIAETDTATEVILIGKGLGFGKRRGNMIEDIDVDKLFVLADKEEQEEYKRLLHEVDEKLVGVMDDAIRLVHRRIEHPLNKRIHIALTDHIGFAIRRLEQGIDIENPFLEETEMLYPNEFQIAQDVVDLINEKMGVALPASEVGFVALHIFSAISNRSMADVNDYSHLLKQLVETIEEHIEMELNRQSIHYSRLVSHLRQAIDRTINQENQDVNEKLIKVLKDDYPVCYNISWKLLKLIERRVSKPVPKAELIYLTLHLQRLTSKNSRT